MYVDERVRESESALSSSVFSLKMIPMISRRHQRPTCAASSSSCSMRRLLNLLPPRPHLLPAVTTRSTSVTTATASASFSMTSTSAGDDDRDDDQENKNQPRPRCFSLSLSASTTTATAICFIVLARHHAHHRRRCRRHTRCRTTAWAS